MRLLLVEMRFRDLGRGVSEVKALIQLDFPLLLESEIWHLDPFENA